MVLHARYRTNTHPYSRCGRSRTLRSAVHERTEHLDTNPSRENDQRGCAHPEPAPGDGHAAACMPERRFSYRTPCEQCEHDSDQSQPEKTQDQHDCNADMCQIITEAGAENHAKRERSADRGCRCQAGKLEGWVEVRDLTPTLRASGTDRESSKVIPALDTFGCAMGLGASFDWLRWIHASSQLLNSDSSRDGLRFETSCQNDKAAPRASEGMVLLALGREEPPSCV